MDLLEKYVASLINGIRALYQHSHKLPIGPSHPSPPQPPLSLSYNATVVFYRYMWENNRSLLVKTIFFNYIFQLVLEALPYANQPTKLLINLIFTLSYQMVGQ